MVRKIVIHSSNDTEELESMVNKFFLEQVSGHIIDIQYRVVCNEFSSAIEYSVMIVYE